MNVLNAIPIFGWLIASTVCLFAAVPVSLLWNWLAPAYFYWLPGIYLNLPFWHVVGLLWLLASLKQILLPKFVTTVNTKKD